MVKRQECDNCYYPAPIKEDEVEQEVPQGAYIAPDQEECPQCFYEEGKDTKPAQDDEDCPQCFYQPESPAAKEAQEEESEDCAQCFYQPGK